MNSSTFKIFQIEKNNEDVRKKVLTNLMKMLTERKLLNKDNLEKNIKNITNEQSDDYSYMIKIDNYATENDKVIAVKIFHQKITAISKQSNISDFLLKYKEIPKIVIVKSINTKAAQYITSNHQKTEIFIENDLMINLIDNTFVPKYEILDTETDDFKQFCIAYNCKKRQIPKMLTTDPVARYYNLKKGNIVRILRPSESTGTSPFYRIVV